MLLGDSGDRPIGRDQIWITGEGLSPTTAPWISPPYSRSTKIRWIGMWSVVEASVPKTFTARPFEEALSLVEVRVRR